ncbi:MULTISPECIES: hypothetical protein [Paraburkholderia]|uniref:Uncharacterized protein n=1 Tax=Paraburkholderia madseniana TaxID=2599607 RepID=A0AAP5BKV4_9BURK|nr:MULTISPECIES: hypothetical protein [Paraburkholderia]MCX4150009.1 hypothetical protein [Paraburkholderia madseniana]MCX4177799.1 hypothetical protein [Paraburkholderia madseniana]MDN7152945.1 hypothetical protein [Paraburkholderia sp. WS6]MDQ6411827.1 hypothetical protein [Paraburkholderia madseniana]MDQ6465786.1 hypothetical protein [Paraburkholderia madseniana]
MSAQLVERWEGAAKGARYQIDVMRIEPRPGREFFDIRLSRDARQYDSKLARSPAEARGRVQHAVDWALSYGPAPYTRTFRDPKLAPVACDAHLILTAQANRFELAARLALFLVKRKGDRAARWSGTLLAAEQRALFGRFLGKGTLTIDGARERIRHSVSRSFGMGRQVTADLAWTEL